jgi:hypothetical protein
MFSRISVMRSLDKRVDVKDDDPLRAASAVLSARKVPACASSHSFLCLCGCFVSSPGPYIPLAQALMHHGSTTLHSHHLQFAVHIAFRLLRLVY